jgi:hypothetical protein
MKPLLFYILDISFLLTAEKRVDMVTSPCYKCINSFDTDSVLTFSIAI